MSRRRKLQVLRRLVTNAPHKSFSVALSLYLSTDTFADFSHWASYFGLPLVTFTGLRLHNWNKPTGERVRFINNDRHKDMYNMFTTRSLSLDEEIEFVSCEYMTINSVLPVVSQQTSYCFT